MKPSFALNLSHEGISLLHRATAGWLRIGDVALDDPDLSEQLKMLRKTAADLESGGLTSKLVIPNSQVLYTEIEAPGPDTAARKAQIRKGLVGLTPYDVGDLVFDWQLKGTRAQVAVVARETLQEAEAFALEYRFNPVSFIARPASDGFDGEPFFGPTNHAADLLDAGETVEPDDEMIQVLATGQPRKTAPRPGRKSRPKPEPAVAAAPAPGFRAAPRAATPPGKAPTPARAKPAKRARKPKKQAPVVPAAATGGATDAEPVTFASRRAAPPAQPPARAEPPLSASGADLAPVAAPARATAAQPAAATNTSAPALAAARAAAAAAPVAGFSHDGSALDIDDVPEMPAWRTVNGREISDITPLPVTAAHTADMPKPGPATNPARDKAKTKAASAALAGSIGKLGHGAASGLRRMRQRQEEVVQSGREADAMTVFGARGKPRIGGKPRYMGLLLTLLLLMALAVLALWSSLFLGEPGTELFPGDEQPQVAATGPGEPAVETPADRAVPEVNETVLAETAPPATDVAEPDPVTPLENPIDTAVVTALLETPDPDAGPETVLPGSIDDPQTDTGLAPSPNLAEPDATDSPPPDRIAEPPPSRAQAEASYAATGIWQLDPDPLPEATGGDRLEDLHVASIGPVIRSQDTVAIPDAGPLLNDTRPPSLTPPQQLGTQYDFDERGLVRATPEGALSPDGVRVFAGTPPVVPRPRPGTALPEQPQPVADPEPAAPAAGPEPALDPERERLRNIRPRPRPASLQETNLRSNPQTDTGTELAENSPAVQPGAAHDEIAAETAVEEAAPQDDGGTELAVPTSRMPSGRPANFATTVQRAVEEATRANPDPEPRTRTRTETEVAAAVVPTIPTTASVAAQATQRNAINLGKVNLIGVYGSASDRRALIRLKSGRYVKVEVGDRVDGGRVSAIGDDELRYVKGGRNITLKLPRG